MIDEKAIARSVKARARRKFGSDIEEPWAKAWITRQTRLEISRAKTDVPPTEAALAPSTEALGEILVDAGKVVPHGRQAAYHEDLDHDVDKFVGVDMRPRRERQYHDPEAFVEHYGLRSVEFGRWMRQADRMRFLYAAARSLDELATMLGVSAQAIGLGGTLSVALGARGLGGGALAHYEPEPYSVINMTRTHPDTGSFAHEYGHALDNFLSVKSGSRGYVSGGRTTTKDRLQTTNPIAELFEGVFERLYWTRDGSQTAFQTALLRHTEYIQRRVEVWARTFEVITNIRTDDVDNRFLVKSAAYYRAQDYYPNRELLTRSGALEAIDAVLTRAAAMMRDALGGRAQTVPPTVDTSKPLERPSSSPRGQASAATKSSEADRQTLIETRSERIPAEYRLVELEQLVASHNELSFAPDPRYPSGCQQRDYTRDPAEQQKVVRNAQAFNPRFLVMDTPTATDGPPIVTYVKTASLEGMAGRDECVVSERVTVADGKRRQREVDVDLCTRRTIDGRAWAVDYRRGDGVTIEVWKDVAKPAKRDLKRIASWVVQEGLDRQTVLLDRVPALAGDQDGIYIVLGGNSRTMSLKRLDAAARESYRAYLRRSAPLFGYTASDVDALTAPVLVRVVDVDMDRCAAYSNMLNKALTQELDATTESVSLARQLTDDQLTSIGQIFEQADTETIADALSNPRVVREIVTILRRAGIVTDSNVSTYLDPVSGTITRQGKLQIEGILLGSILPDRSLIEAARSYTDKILRALPLMIRLRSLQPQWSLIDAMQQAIRLEAERRASGVEKWSFVRQGSMHRPEIDRNVIIIWDMLDEGPRKFAEFLNRYLRTAEAEQQRDQYGGGGLIVMDEISPEEAIERAAGILPAGVADGLMTIADVMAVKTKPVNLYRMKPLLERLNEPFRIAIWGEEGSGKSTFKCLLEADLEGIGKVLDVMTEERIAAGRLTNRMRLTQALLRKTIFTDDMSMADVRELVRRDPEIRTVVVDSLNEWGVTEPQMIDFTKEHPDVNFVVIMQATKKGDQPRNFSKIPYLFDCVIMVEDGVATTKKHRDADKGRSMRIFSHTGTTAPVDREQVQRRLSGLA